jgi:hypothetical protein
MRIASLNLQNLRLLRDGGRAHLHGARDRDEPAMPEHDEPDRRLTAGLLAATGADVLALQEVFDAESLDFFHDHYLAPVAGPYRNRLCLPGNDGRGLDVAVMARRDGTTRPATRHSCRAIWASRRPPVSPMTCRSSGATVSSCASARSPSSSCISRRRRRIRRCRGR